MHNITSSIILQINKEKTIRQCTICNKIRFINKLKDVREKLKEKPKGASLETEIKFLEKLGI